ncbi:MAG: topoisomerase C-terminal repeat-containing protein, partial [Clostridia bacterium]|nr:topoisomerase C-terminal repeat-containing protein [Clostridia bacterium]
FGFHNVICGRTISLSNARLLLETGRTSKIVGFVSRAGKPFDAVLVLRDGRAVFDFPDLPTIPSAEGQV